MDKILEMEDYETLGYDKTVDVLFDKTKEIITKVNEIVEVINSLEYDDYKMTSIQNRGGSNA